MSAINRRQVRRLLSKIEREKIALAKHRDKLRDLLDELENIADCTDRAEESLTAAVDALSELL